MTKNDRFFKYFLPIFFLAFFGFFSSAYAWEWTVTGGANYSTSSKEYVSMAFHPVTGEKYVAFQDMSNQFKVTVKKYNATSSLWELVGAAGFSDWQANYISLAFNPATNEPYVAFEDFSNPSNEATVMRFNGSSWVVVGSKGFTASQVQQINLTFNPSTNEPYVVYRDFSVGNKVSVMKFNGSSWSQVGSAGFSVGIAAYLTTAFNPTTNEPYVAYSDGGISGKASVMKFNGTSWGQVGTAGFSDDASYYISLDFNASTSEPYVAYANGSANFQATVMKFNGSSWVNVGRTDFNSAETVYLDLTFNPWTNVPYVVYQGGVKKLNGNSWINVGSTDLSNYGRQAVIEFDPLTHQPSIAFAGTVATDTSGTIFDFYEPLNIVESPYALPYGNLYSTGQTVVLTSSTTGAIIYYTIDGTTPTTNSLVYTEPISVASSKTIKAVAVKSGQPDSNIMSEEYRISEWEYVGPVGLSAASSSGSYAKIVFNPVTNEPYVSYQDFSSGKLKVFRHSTTSETWVTVGSSLASGLAYTPRMAISPVTGEPYVFYTDSGLSYQGVVKKFDGSSWVDVGATLFDDTFYNRGIDIAIHPVTGEPYVVYDNPATRRAVVARYDATSTLWTTVGASDITFPYPYSKIAFNPSTFEPYIAYVDLLNGEKATVVRYSTTSATWVTVGSAGFTADNVSLLSRMSLAFNPFTFEPYVAYSDFGNDAKTTVMKYSTTSSTWVTVGSAGFSQATTSSDNVSIAFNPATYEPYVAYSDSYYSRKLTVMRYDTASSTWTVVGLVPGFTPHYADGTLAFNPSTYEPYVAYTDSADGYSISVKKVVNPQASTPTPSTSGGVYGSTQSITLTSGTEGSTIYYTTDGSAPTSTSTQYASAISISTTTTLKAIAIKSNYSNSSVMSETYTINLPQAATPSASTSSGIFSNDQSITLSSATEGVTIYYTIDGSTPTTGSTEYTSPISVTSSTTIKAIAVKSLYINSEIMTEMYDFNVATVTADIVGGTFSSSQTVTLSSLTSGASIYYTTDGTDPSQSSTLYSTPINITSTTTLKAIAIKSGYSNSSTTTEVYEFVTADPVASTPSGTFSSLQSVTLTTTTSGATIYYTIDGSIPTTGSTQYSVSISINALTTLKAIAVKSGYTNSSVMSETYTFQSAIPTATPVGRSSSSTDTITLTTTTSGATIYYTVDGSTPTTGSTEYTSPISITSSTTIKAITVKSGYINSSVMSEDYIIYSKVDIPTATPVGRASSSTESVTLVTTTNDATIYYTTDGSTPTVDSTQYSSPVSISSSATLKAIAVKNNYTNSDVMSEDYTIASQVITPVASPSSINSSSTQMVTISSATASSTIYYTTDGSDPTTGSTQYSSPLTISTTTTLKAMATRLGYTNSSIMSEDYVVYPKVATPTASTSGGFYTTTKTTTLSVDTPTATIYYTTDGTTPTRSSTQYSSETINISTTTQLKAIAVLDNYTNSEVMTENYSINLSGTSTILSNNYTVSNISNSSGTITNIPYGISKAIFMSALRKGQSEQTWNVSAVSDPVVTGNAIIVTAQDGINERTYILNVLTLSSNQATTSDSGSATINATTTQVVITDTSKQFNVSVSTTTSNPTINFGSLIANGTGTLPSIIVNSSNANNVTLLIPTSTVITSASTTWNGIINAPATTTVTLPTESGQTKTLVTAIEVGVPGETLLFNKALRMLLPNQANKRAGYISTSTFTEIITTCSSDTQTAGDALSEGGECKIDSGSDLVIWTKHFTTFATYTQTTTPVVSSGGGGGGGVSYFAYGSPTYSSITSYTTTSTTTSTISNLIVSTSTKSTNNTPVLIKDISSTKSSNSSKTINTEEILSFGSKGDAVLSLQNFLFNEGYMKVKPNGYFGPSTKAAVKLFQSKYADELLTPQGFKSPTGMVGEATREKINELLGSVSNITSKSDTNINISTNLNQIQQTASSKTINTEEILSFGSKGDAVLSLQNFLFNEGYMKVKPNGYFGPSTKAAVKLFQSKYADELLTPQGFKSPTGMVGEATREKINELLGGY